MDVFGSSVALFGDTLVVGAKNESSAQTTVTHGATSPTDDAAPQAGAVYVFKRTGTTWAQEAYLKASNAEAMDHFGASVAISQDVIVVGAEHEDSNQTTVTNGAIASDDNSAPVAGAAYVFQLVAGAWTQTAYLKASSAMQEGYYARSVCIDGDVIVAGAYGEGTRAGAAYVVRMTAQ